MLRTKFAQLLYLNVTFLIKFNTPRHRRNCSASKNAGKSQPEKYTKCTVKIIAQKSSFFLGQSKAYGAQCAPRNSTPQPTSFTVSARA